MRKCGSIWNNKCFFYVAINLASRIYCKNYQRSGMDSIFHGSMIFIFAWSNFKYIFNRFHRSLYGLPAKFLKNSICRNRTVDNNQQIINDPFSR